MWRTGKPPLHPDVYQEHGKTTTMRQAPPFMNPIIVDDALVEDQRDDDVIDLTSMPSQDLSPRRKTRENINSAATISNNTNAAVIIPATPTEYIIGSGNQKPFKNITSIHDVEQIRSSSSLYHQQGRNSQQSAGGLTNDAAEFNPLSPKPLVSPKYHNPSFITQNDAVYDSNRRTIQQGQQHATGNNNYLGGNSETAGKLIGIGDFRATDLVETRRSGDSYGYQSHQTKATPPLSPPSPRTPPPASNVSPNKTSFGGMVGNSGYNNLASSGSNLEQILPTGLLQAANSPKQQQRTPPSSPSYHHRSPLSSQSHQLRSPSSPSHYRSPPHSVPSPQQQNHGSSALSDKERSNSNTNELDSNRVAVSVDLAPPVFPDIVMAEEEYSQHLHKKDYMTRHYDEYTTAAHSLTGSTSASDSIVKRYSNKVQDDTTNSPSNITNPSNGKQNNQKQTLSVINTFNAMRPSRNVRFHNDPMPPQLNIINPSRSIDPVIAPDEDANKESFYSKTVRIPWNSRLDAGAETTVERISKLYQQKTPSKPIAAKSSSESNKHGRDSNITQNPINLENEVENNKTGNKGTLWSRPPKDAPPSSDQDVATGTGDVGFDREGGKSRLSPNHTPSRLSVDDTIKMFESPSTNAKLVCSKAGRSSTPDKIKFSSREKTLWRKPMVTASRSFSPQKNANPPIVLSKSLSPKKAVDIVGESKQDEISPMPRSTFLPDLLRTSHETKVTTSGLTTDDHKRRNESESTDNATEKHQKEVPKITEQKEADRENQILTDRRFRVLEKARALLSSPKSKAIADKSKRQLDTADDEDISQASSEENETQHLGIPDDAPAERHGGEDKSREDCVDEATNGPSSEISPAEMQNEDKKGNQELSLENSGLPFDEEEPLAENSSVEDNIPLEKSESKDISTGVNSAKASTDFFREISKLFSESRDIESNQTGEEISEKENRNTDIATEEQEETRGYGINGSHGDSDDDFEQEGLEEQEEENQEHQLQEGEHEELSFDLEAARRIVAALSPGKMGLSSDDAKRESDEVSGSDPAGQHKSDLANTENETTEDKEEVNGNQSGKILVAENITNEKEGRKAAETELKKSQSDEPKSSSIFSKWFSNSSPPSKEKGGVKIGERSNDKETQIDNNKERTSSSLEKSGSLRQNTEVPKTHEDPTYSEAGTGRIGTEKENEQDESTDETYRREVMWSKKRSYSLPEARPDSGTLNNKGQQSTTKSERAAAFDKLRETLMKLDVPDDPNLELSSSEDQPRKADKGNTQRYEPKSKNASGKYSEDFKSNKSSEENQRKSEGGRVPTTENMERNSKGTKSTEEPASDVSGSKAHTALKINIEKPSGVRFEPPRRSPEGSFKDGERQKEIGDEPDHAEGMSRPPTKSSPSNRTTPVHRNGGQNVLFQKNKTDAGGDESDSNDRDADETREDTDSKISLVSYLGSEDSDLDTNFESSTVSMIVKLLDRGCAWLEGHNCGFESPSLLKESKSKAKAAGGGLLNHSGNFSTKNIKRKATLFNKYAAGRFTRKEQPQNIKNEKKDEIPNSQSKRKDDGVEAKGEGITTKNETEGKKPKSVQHDVNLSQNEEVMDGTGEDTPMDKDPSSFQVTLQDPRPATSLIAAKAYGSDSGSKSINWKTVNRNGENLELSGTSELHPIHVERDERRPIRAALDPPVEVSRSTAESTINLLSYDESHFQSYAEKDLMIGTLESNKYSEGYFGSGVPRDFPVESQGPLVSNYRKDPESHVNDPLSYHARNANDDFRRTNTREDSAIRDAAFGRSASFSGDTQRYDPISENPLINNQNLHIERYRREQENFVRHGIPFYRSSNNNNNGLRPNVLEDRRYSSIVPRSASYSSEAQHTEGDTSNDSMAKVSGNYSVIHRNGNSKLNNERQKLKLDPTVSRSASFSGENHNNGHDRMAPDAVFRRLSNRQPENHTQNTSSYFSNNISRSGRQNAALESSVSRSASLSDETQNKGRTNKTVDPIPRLSSYYSVDGPAQAQELKRVENASFQGDDSDDLFVISESFSSQNGNENNLVRLPEIERNLDKSGRFFHTDGESSDPPEDISGDSKGRASPMRIQKADPQEVRSTDGVRHVHSTSESTHNEVMKKITAIDPEADIYGFHRTMEDIGKAVQDAESNGRGRPKSSKSPSSRTSKKYEKITQIDSSVFKNLTEEERLAALELAERLRHRAEKLKKRRKKREQRLKQQQLVI